MMSPASPDLLLDVGDRLPDETMQDERGRSVSLYRQTLAGRQVILYLSDDLADADAKKHLTDFQKILLPIRQFDAFVFAVGRGTSADHAPLIQELGLQYLLLSDPEPSLCRRLGLGRRGPGPVTVVLDPNLRLIARIEPGADVDHAAGGLAAVRAQRAKQGQTAVRIQAPVLILPNVLPPDLCRTLIRRWESEPHVENSVASGRVGGNVQRTTYKTRDDFFMPPDDPDATTVLQLLRRRLLPEIRKVFNFDITHIETIRIGGYDAKNGGYFRPHRDNDSRITAHRRFAMSLNLNSGEYEGGGVRFSEYGPQIYHAETGGAVVFSCGLLHEALPVTTGRRMGLFTFMYDDKEEQLRRRLETEDMGGRGTTDQTREGTS